MRALLAGLIVLAAGSAPAAAEPPPGFVNHGLVAAARIPPAQHDFAGETLAGIGSAIAFGPESWGRTRSGYRGTLFMITDRGWDKQGTLDYRARIQEFALSLAPLQLDLLRTILLHEPDGTPMTGLDPSTVRPAAHGLPDLPIAPNGHVSLDNESLAIAPDRTFWVGDEYGPYIYHYAADGMLLGAIRPPDAFIPMRGGVENFSSNNPMAGQPRPAEARPRTGRANNQGFEGLTLVPGRAMLYALLQSALVQDGGDHAATRRNTRLLAYDVADAAHPKLVGEYVVPLPLYADPLHPGMQVATANEICAVNDHVFLFLAHDRGRGAASHALRSVYRRVGVIDVAGATNIAGTPYDGATPVAPHGVLAAGIVPVHVADFIDMNDDAELARFGFHNGPPDDGNDLYGKWEGLALASALDPRAPDDFFLVVSGDNDFITQHGMINGRFYSDPSGRDIDSTVLAYRITLPGAPGGGPPSAPGGMPPGAPAGGAPSAGGD